MAAKYFLYIALVVVFAYVTAVANCPQGCECKVAAVKCQGVHKSTVFYNNDLITAVTFKDSLVNVEQVLKAYENVQLLEILNSVAIHCPHDHPQVVFKGACKTTPDDDTHSKHNFIDEDKKYAKFVNDMIDNANSLNSHATECDNTKINKLKLVDEDDYDL